MTNPNRKKSQVKLLFLLICMTNSLFLFSQLRIIYGEPFDSLFKKAELELENENYIQSSEWFDKAFSVREDTFPSIMIYSYAFLANYNSGKINQAVFFLENYAKRGFINDETYHKLTNDKKYEKLRNHTDWGKIKKIIDKKRSEYGRIFNRLEEINTADQTLRLLFKCSETELKDESQRNFLNSLIEVVDRTNLACIDSIVLIHGWLGKYKVGEQGNSAMWKVIQHSTLDVQEKYLPLIEKSVKKGETPASKLAFLVDRINLYKGQYQIYGTQIVKDSDGKNKVYPIENPEEVDNRRFSLGFEPLVEYLNFFDVKIETTKDLQLDYLLDFWKR